MQAISGTMLRDLLVCERRLGLDMHGEPSRRDDTSPFVRMLWRDGIVHECAILEAMTGNVVDLRELDIFQREKRTLVAIAQKAETILGAVLRLDDLVGMPDVLRWTVEGYMACDVKSGAAVSGPNGTYKLEYVIQVAHYAYLLVKAGLGRGDVAAIIDADGVETRYDLLMPLGRDRVCAAERHVTLLAHARRIRDAEVETRGALSAMCGLCDWRSVCRDELAATDDLTRIAGLGRSLRGLVETVAPTVAALAATPQPTVNGGTGVKGLGVDRLSRFITRARLLADPGAGPVILGPLDLSANSRRIDFDVEADPSRGIVYLHGFWHESDSQPDGHFVHFFAPTPDLAGEREAFAATIAHFRDFRDAHWFHYSAYERTSYRALQRRHPDVCDEDEIATIFASERCTDLYDVISRHTDWPLSSYGLKSIAKSIGFSWEDLDPGGA